MFNPISCIWSIEHQYTISRFTRWHGFFVCQNLKRSYIRRSRTSSTFSSILEKGIHMFFFFLLFLYISNKNLNELEFVVVRWSSRIYIKSILYFWKFLFGYDCSNGCFSNFRRYIILFLLIKVMIELLDKLLFTFLIHLGNRNLQTHFFIYKFPGKWFHPYVFSSLLLTIYYLLS